MTDPYGEPFFNYEESIKKWNEETKRHSGIPYWDGDPMMHRDEDLREMLREEERRINELREEERRMNELREEESRINELRFKTATQMGEQIFPNYNFALVGVAGYIAPKHLQAIEEIKASLIASLDINDSVGILDKYNINSEFFTSEEDFYCFIKQNPVDYISICSPNYLHKKHIEKSLETGANVICEKPLVIKSSDLADLMYLEKFHNKKINTILQLRLHPKIVELKEHIQNNKERYKVKIDYITPRGNWYFKSWKGDKEKSGGVVFNIGIHLFDMVLWLFGEVNNFKVYNNQVEKASGVLNLARADVEWFLSLDKNDLLNKKQAHRKIQINDDKVIDLSESFTNLHTSSYKKILIGEGFGIKDIQKSIELIEKINLQ